MCRFPWPAVLAVAGFLLPATASRAQTRPYVGYVYPAGGQQGSTFEVKIGGQNLNDVTGVIVSGTGVSARMVEYCFPLGNRESALLRRQLAELKKSRPKIASTKKLSPEAASRPEFVEDPATTTMIERIERLIREDERFPASVSMRSIVLAEVKIDANAAAGPREMRLVTLRGGPSNPLVFCVGEVPEYSREAMRTAPRQILGREYLAMRNRPDGEAEQRVELPCTVNGQIASGEVNSYRFTASKGQRLVITTQARQLIPYIADAVPGWFQPVIVLRDADGKEVAYDDDYRFDPDPVILCRAPHDGEYVLSIYDALYRGRNDFVYRISIGETPFVTSIFPLGLRLGQPNAIKPKGWNLEGAKAAQTAPHTPAGLQQFVVHRNGVSSNPVPFAVSELPETLEKEPNDSPACAQKLKLPVIVNGRIGKPDDEDVFQFQGRSGQVVVLEVAARRLASPLDSIVKLTDPDGKLLVLNDDREDLASGLNTHHADSYVMATLPADGSYHVHLGDAARRGGPEYAYRLRVSDPLPNFALRVVPSSVSFRSQGSASLTVYAIRQDGFDGDIKLDLKDPPPGFKTAGAKLTAGQPSARITIRTSLATTDGPVSLRIAGTATAQGTIVVQEAVPAEDRMQAFLWRHLVPAQELTAIVYDPKFTPPPQRVPPELTRAQLDKASAVVAEAEAKGRKFTAAQVAGVARGIKSLYEKGLLTDEFYGDRIAELGFAR